MFCFVVITRVWLTTRSTRVCCGGKGDGIDKIKFNFKKLGVKLVGGHSWDAVCEKENGVVHVKKPHHGTKGKEAHFNMYMVLLQK